MRVFVKSFDGLQLVEVKNNVDSICRSEKNGYDLFINGNNFKELYTKDTINKIFKEISNALTKQIIKQNQGNICVSIRDTIIIQLPGSDIDG